MYNFKKLKQLRRKATTDEKTNGSFVRDAGIQPKDPQTAIQELSKYTLARYQMKAADDLRDRGVDQGASIGMKAAGMKPATDMKKNSKKMSKRVVGIGKAANKLTQKTNEEKQKSFRSLIGPEGPGMKRLRAKQDAIPMTDKSGRVSRSRMQKKFGRFINTEEHMSEEESYAKIDSFHAHPDGKFTIGVKHKAGRFADEKKVMHTGSMQHLQKVTKKYPLTSRVSVHSVKTGRENIKEEHLIEDGHTDVASSLRKCKTIMEDASDIHTKLAMMGTMDSLPSWWTNKLAVAAAYMDSMRDYLLYPTNESFNESKKIKVIKKVAKDKIIGKKDPFEPDPDITTQVIRTDSPDNT